MIGGLSAALVYGHVCVVFLATCNAVDLGTSTCAASTSCPSDSWPTLAEPSDYMPRGTEDSIADLPIYYVGVPGPKAVIVLPEIFGWAGRLKGVCDTLAAEGFFVVMPDCHRRDTAQGKASVPDFVREYSYNDVVGPDFDRLMKWLSAKGVSSIGAVGHCWGAWAFSKASASGVELKCGVGLHPSTRIEAVMGGNEVEMMRQVRMPIFFMPASNDPDTLKPGGEIAELIQEKGGAIEEFPDMKHGWTTRGDLSDPAVKRDVEQAMQKTITFLRRHL